MKANNSKLQYVSKIPKADSIAFQVSNRKAEYESKKATEEGLIKLGEQTAYIKEKNRQWDIRYEYLNSVANELRNFDEIKFMNGLKNLTSKAQTLAEFYKLIGYISNSNKLNEYHLEHINSLKKKIISKKIESDDWEEMADQYMNELEEVEQTLKQVTNKLEEVEQKFKNYKKIAENKFRERSNYIKYTSIGNILIVIMSIGWLVYNSYF